MSIESTIYAALKTLVGGRVYRDIRKKDEGLPYITFQQVGGTPLNYLDRTKPSKKNARMQINCWHNRRDDVMALARQVEDALLAVTVKPQVLGAAIADYEEDTGLYGSIQDFSFWYDD